MTGLEHAVQALRVALDSPARRRSWQTLVRRRMAEVVEVLEHEHARRAEDAWLAAREHHLLTERDRLAMRLATLAPVLPEVPDAGTRARLDRLVLDLQHHHQRLNDLVYDSVSLELGGSE